MKVRIPLRAAALGLSAHAVLNARLLRVPPPPADVPERVSVLVPARDEAHRLGPTVRAVLDSEHVPDLELLVLDDASTDATAEVATAAAAGDRRLRLVRRDTDPPPGWLGKPWACARLAELADPRSTVLVFLDADVRLEPDGLARTLRLLREAELSYVSPYPRQVAETAAERLVQPLLQWSWLTFLPLRLAEHSARPSTAVANGQLLAVDRDTYDRAGGHRRAADAVLEDIAVARVLRAAGASGGMVDGTGVASCRMYDGWPELRDGYVKSLWAAAGGSPAASAAQVVLLLALYCRPDPVAYVAGVVGRVVAARRTGGRVLPDTLVHPLSVAVWAGLTGLSWSRHRTGAATWKGRRLPGRDALRPRPDAPAGGSLPVP